MNKSHTRLTYTKLYHEYLYSSAGEIQAHLGLDPGLEHKTKYPALCQETCIAGRTCSPKTWNKFQIQDQEHGLFLYGGSVYLLWNLVFTITKQWSWAVVLFEQATACMLCFVGFFQSFTKF